MKALITGATGFIGRALAAKLDQPVVLTRDLAKAGRILPGLKAFAWEPTSGPPPAEAFEGIEVVFNLMGDPIAKGRWSPEKIGRIRESRVIGTRNLVAGIAGMQKKPAALVSASAIGYYGSRGDEVLDETSAPGTDTMAGICGEWEAAALKAQEAGVRVVCVRNGIVLRREGGALAEMLLPFRMGVGGPLGSGRQWMSWIHLEDLLGIYLLAASHPDLAGPVNGTSPNPATNLAFTKALGGAVHRPAVLPVPGFAVKLAFGGVAEVMLGSQRVLPRVAEKAGFTFRFPELGTCLRAAVA